MLAYAFRALHQVGAGEVMAEEFDHLHDLLAAILVHGLNRQIKQGLYRDYALRNEELAGVRGRIDVADSLKRLSFTQGRLACEFDEFTIDTPHNRILKSTIKVLLRHGEVGRDQKVALRRIVPYLDAAADIEPRAFRWDQLTIHRNNATYRLLLGICDLIMRGLLPSTQSGDYKLAQWLPDEYLHQLFENFVRAYYKYHRPDLSPHSAQIKWDLSPGEFSDLLPVMETDIFLTDGDRTLIIDTKYYQSAFQHREPHGARNIFPTIFTRFTLTSKTTTRQEPARWQGCCYTLRRASLMHQTRLLLWAAVTSKCGRWTWRGTGRISKRS